VRTNGGGGRLVNDSENSETGDGSGILGSSSLSVVEVYALAGRRMYVGTHSLQAGTVTTA
jgi:hypothetical protein